MNVRRPVPWTLAGLAAAGVIAAAALQSGPAAADATITIYKHPSCGCCGRWADYLAAEGFTIEMRDVQDISAVKAEQGVPADLGSCHTAVADGYVIEGHVPADAIRRLLADRPAVRGIAVPGMPAGSPGMEGPPPVPYNVVAFDAEGRRRIIARY